mgnify:CR=1 FL=1
MNMSIRAPSHAKQERLVVDFKTKKQHQTDRIVETLEGMPEAKFWSGGQRLA